MSADPLMLVTVVQASQHLRRDSAHDDAELTFKIQAASERVMAYIQPGLARYTLPGGMGYLPPYANPDGTFKSPVAVQHAVLILVGYLYSNRDEDEKKEFEDGQLPRPVRALVRHIRQSVLA